MILLEFWPKMYCCSSKTLWVKFLPNN